MLTKVLYKWWSPVNVLLIAFIFLSPYRVLAEDELEIIGPEYFKETRTQKMWQADRSKRIRSADDVKSYLQQLNQGQYSDWRLPDKKELYNLFVLFDLKQNGEVKTRLEGYYWLGDEKGIPVVGGWEIGDQCGPSRTFYKGKSGYIRAIRP